MAIKKLGQRYFEWEERQMLNQPIISATRWMLYGMAIYFAGVLLLQ